jgi:hypothetical protein
MSIPEFSFKYVDHVREVSIAPRDVTAHKSREDFPICKIINVGEGISLDPVQVLSG